MNKNKTEFKSLLNNIKCFVFDVDGVLTNGLVHITETGDLLRQMHVKDGYALKTALEKGYEIAIISAGFNEGVKIRLRDLGITNIYMGVSDKALCFDEFCDIYQINRKEVLYMGDDMPDYQVMQQVCLACCPQDAVVEIKSISHYVSHQKGGFGCVRDVIEQVLKVQGNW